MVTRPGRIALLLVPAALLISGFTCWMQSSAYVFSKGEVCTINFLRGELFDGNPWTIDGNKLATLTHASFSGTVSVLAFLKQGTGGDLALPLNQEGTQLISFETIPILTAIGRDEFEEAIENAGLSEPAPSEDSVNVLLTRSGKLLLQVGKVSGSTFRKELGQPLEIIPLVNPYMTPRGRQLAFQVLFNGQPLRFAQLKVWNRKGLRVLVQKIYTEKDGTITTPLSNEGVWMVTAETMAKKASVNGTWQRYESTLVFGLPEN
jgi:Domain of unknown function (DUF4198)